MHFWISHPTNTLIGNSAAGGEGAGIWYDFNYNSDNTNIFESINQPFGLDQDNTAHSHNGPEPSFPDHAAGSGIILDTYYGDFAQRGSIINPTAWKNAGFGLWIDGAVKTTNPAVINNSQGLNCQNTVVEGGLLMGNSANTGTENANIEGLLRFYHGQCDVSGSWLAGFNRNEGSHVGLTALSDAAASSYDYTNRIKGLKFIGEGRKVSFDSPAYEGPEAANGSHWVADLDGSVLGDGKPVYITNNRPFLRTASDRTLYPNVTPYYNPGISFGTISPLDSGVMRFDFESEVTVTRTSDGVRGFGISPGMRMGQRYQVEGGAVSSASFNVRTSDAGYVDVVYNWNGSASPTVTVKGYNTQKTLTRASSLANLGVDGQYVLSGGKLYLRVTQGGSIPFGSGGDTRGLTMGDQQDWTVQ